MSRQTCELVIIGDELLAGEVQDVNTAYISDRISSLGIPVSRVTIAPDDPRQLHNILTETLERSSLVIASGGLGPTSDDYTRKVAAEIFDRDLYVNKRLLETMTRRYAGLGRRISAMGRTQAMVPRGAKLLSNPSGAAPGIILTDPENTLILLPGVPDEVRGIMDSGLASYLASHVKSALSHTALFRTAGVFETDLAKRIQPICKRYPETMVSYLPCRGGVDLRISTTSARKLSALTKTFVTLLGRDLYTVGRKSLSAVVGELLIKNSATLAVAESCTGGLVGGKIVDVPGSSRYFLGGVISYSNQAKTELLGVDKKLIDSKGAVSADVAAAMAEGVRGRFTSTYGLAVTGIAGPGGGTKNKPRGLTFIGLSSPRTTLTRKAVYPGSRRTVRERSVKDSLDLLRRELLRCSARTRQDK